VDIYKKYIKSLFVVTVYWRKKTIMEIIYKIQKQKYITEKCAVKKDDKTVIKKAEHMEADLICKTAPV